MAVVNRVAGYKGIVIALLAWYASPAGSYPFSRGANAQELPSGRDLLHQEDKPLDINHEDFVIDVNLVLQG